MWLSRARCALLLVDLQHAFCASDGDLARRGRNIGPMQSAARCCSRLAVAARAAGVPVIWTRMMLRADYADGGRMTSDLLPHLKAAGALRRGSPDVALVEGLGVEPQDEIIDKPRNSALLGTPLEVQLHARGVERVIVGGVTTSMCVDTTVRDLGQRDFATFVVREAVGDFDAARHAAALAVMAFGFARVIGESDCLAALQGDGLDL
ncbi:MAG: isochorismatase family cysteine hydrolase [Burkholderiaceae bacterium]